MHVHLGRDPRTDPGCTTRRIISLKECLGIPQEELLPGKRLGFGTELGTFTGIYRIVSVLPSTDSH